jgi:hypothetical protein
MIDEVEIYFQKIKYKHLGKQGVVELYYDRDSGRFTPGAGRDLSNWLLPAPIEPNKLNPKIQFENDFDERKNEAPF